MHKLVVLSRAKLRNGLDVLHMIVWMLLKAFAR